MSRIGCPPIGWMCDLILSALSKGHWGSYKVTFMNWKYRFSSNLFCLDLILSKLYIYVIITKKQVFHNMKYSIESYWRSHMIILIPKNHLFQIVFIHLTWNPSAIFWWAYHWRSDQWSSSDSLILYFC